MTGKSIPVVEDNFLTLADEQVKVGSSAWYAWLEKNKKFKYQGRNGHFLARSETRRNKGVYWYAYRRSAGKLSKIYLGKPESVTKESLEQASVSLAEAQFSNNQKKHQLATFESRIDNSFLPQTKVNAPLLPRRLLPRPHLTLMIDSPLTLIYAPSGFGKSTLINYWRQTCGFPVAWLTIDRNDNQPTRFWNSLVMALQSVDPNLGKKLFNYLRTSSSSISETEVISLLTNDITQFPELGLVLDDFHYIQDSRIFDFLQMWLEQFPPNLQMILSGHRKPPLALGDLRAKGMLTEFDTNSLRFSLEEGVSYLLKHTLDRELAHADLEKLAGHTEGWAAGLTLTALALGKQKDYRQFVDTYSGAHIYFREYFMEAVLQRLPADMESFLLRTSIVKHLTGDLCDALTGQKNGEDMLARLWNENLFVTQLKEENWYRYHDLFAEMLYDQLKTRHPQDVPFLHLKAAKWYNDNHAPADAISHLLAAKAWEEAAILIEEAALRELEQFGEDSRLLRWLLELPESIVQQHQTLLFVYLQLANVSLPRKRIERFISRIENNIALKPAYKQTEDERDVLEKIQQVHKAWAKGNAFELPFQAGSRHEKNWQLLNNFYVLRIPSNTTTDIPEDEIFQFYEMAKQYKNLFVILMSGGSYARRKVINGKLKASEKIAHQVLQQAITLRGSLPEPASIALSALSLVYLERFELDLAQKFLLRAVEIDPNPTSTNTPVALAVVRCKIQLAQGRADKALVTIQSIRELHTKRPSGLWSDLDLMAYEALVYVRLGNLDQAEILLDEADELGRYPLSDLVRAEVYFHRQQFEAAEQILNNLLLKNFPSVQEESILSVRILLSLTLFGQHKINQSRQIMLEAVRMAESENIFRPFVERGAKISPVLTVILETEKLTLEAQNFIRKIFEILEGLGVERVQIPAEELVDLSIAASITAREQDVLCLLGEGKSNLEIACGLSISESTVKTHLSNIYGKLRVDNRVQAATRARELCLI
ncbi:MAG: hypothetical protein JXB38_21860 [Anaerolineales bacterium]|nr:hypothetical protein [Anaerolineales bacterium]